MHELSVSRQVAAPRDRVWSVLTDIDRAPQVMEAIQSVERLDGDRFGVGTRWRETRKVFGREATEVMEVTAVDPPVGYTVHADGPGTRYVSRFTLTEEGDGTRMTMTFGAQPTGLVGRVMNATVGRLAAGATRRAVAADLEDLARACEADGGA